MPIARTASTNAGGLQPFEERLDRIAGGTRHHKPDPGEAESLRHTLNVMATLPPLKDRPARKARLP